MELYYTERVLPGIWIGPIKAEGMKGSELEKQLTSITNYYLSKNTILTASSGTFSITADVAEADISYDTKLSAKKAVEYGKNLTFLNKIRLWMALWRNPHKQDIAVTYDGQWLTEVTATASAALDKPLIPPTLTPLDSDKDGSIDSIQVSYGEAGTRFIKDDFEDQWLQALKELSPLPTHLPTETVAPPVTRESVDAAYERAKKFIDKKLDITFTEDANNERAWTLTAADLINFVAIDDRFDREKITLYLDGIADAIERKPVDAKFIFNTDQKKVVEFAAALDGITLDRGATSEALLRRLAALETEVAVEPLEVSLTRIKPEITLDSVNDLGIITLLGRGYSTYKGSITSRVHNVALAAARINGTLVKPGETFSFNDAVGDVSAETGYQAAYVIRNGRTELGDGGGVCQDSTTVFRAALDAGLPITERRPHSYRVGYYEQNAKAGLDATVFGPTVDLKFLNDTPAHLLIQTITNSETRELTVEIYGTDDGRSATIANHVVWDVTPPPPDVFVDDPTIPTGTTKQIDWKTGGAKAKFDYLVERNGEVIYEKTFYSTYKPWAAVYLRGTGPTP